jgi:UDP:flavonoid glycosyltransferase YjiC (YdhE family)
MKIMLASIGSVGDIRPLIALGKALCEKGDDVTICAPPNLERMIRKHHLPYDAVGIDTQAALSSVAADFMGKPITGLKTVITLLRTMLTMQYTDLRAVVNEKKPDLILGSGLLFTGPTVSEEFKIPYAHACHMPSMFKSKYHSPIEIPFQNMPPILNTLSWSIHELLLNLMLSKTINGIRKNAGLKALKNFLYCGANRLILAMDGELGPMPHDVSVNHLQTGYWNLAEDADVGGPLKDFIESGDPPVYIGFGSMSDPSPAKTFSIIVDAIRNLGIRAVVAKGWAGYGSDGGSDEIFLTDEVPHDGLFPRMKAIVHHGGAGTVWTASRAGIPQVIIPHMGDQFYWAYRIYKMNLGPRPLHRSKMSGARLASAISKAISDVEIKKNCLEIQNKLSQRSGAAEAVDKIKSYFSVG